MRKDGSLCRAVIVEAVKRPEENVMLRSIYIKYIRKLDPLVMGTLIPTQKYVIMQDNFGDVTYLRVLLNLDKKFQASLPQTAQVRPLILVPTQWC